MPTKPQILNENTIAQSRLFCIQQVDLKFSNGETRQFERLRSSNRGAVLIVPLLDDETVLLIREYAVGVDRYELGLPKGLIEANESVIDAANRELMEEVGYGARELTALAELTLAPGYMSHVTTVILARHLYAEKHPGDEPEPIEVVPYALKQISQLLKRPDFTEARSIAALYMAKEFLQS